MMNLLVAWLWQGLLVAAVATLAVRLVPAGAAARRHAIWWLALLLIVVLPVLPSLVATATPDLAPRSATPTAATIAASIAASGTTGTFVLPAPPAWAAAALITLWIATALIGLTRVVIGLRALRALTRNSHPMDPSHEARLTRWMAARNTSRPARLRVSDQIRGACAVGFLEPTLLVSSDLVVTLNDEALESIVLHEFAHLERYDDWTGLLQRLFLACGGLHVALWWISRQIDVEREMACDQRVVVRTGAPVLYARSLADAATVIARGRGQTPVLAPGASTAMLHARVTRLLTRGVANRRFVRLTATAATIGLCLTAAVIGQAPALVAFTTVPAYDAALLAAANLPLAGNLPRAILGLHPGAAGMRANLATGALTARIQVAADVTPTQSLAPQSLAVPGDVAVVTERASQGDELLEAPGETAALPSTPLPTVLPANTSVEAVTLAPTLGGLGQRFASLGAAVGAAGATTGQGAGRAGASIGKWFKDRSADVTGTF